MPDPHDPSEPTPDDLSERLAAMAGRRVAATDRPSSLPTASRRRIRRRERLGAGLAALVVVALVAGGVALARSGQEQATTVRVGQPSGAAACDPTGVPQVVATDVRQLARAGTAVPGVTPQAMVAALPTTASPQLTIDVKAFGGGWDLIITGLHFAPWNMGANGIDPDPGSDNGESVLLGRDLLFQGAASLAVPQDLSALHPIPVSLDPRCETTSEPSSTTTSLNPYAPVSSTSSTVTTTGAPTSTVAGKPGFPDCTASQITVGATTDRSDYAPGDTVHVTVTIRNDGPTCENAPRTAVLNACPHFRVIDSSGKVVYQPTIFCPVPLTLGQVPAGYHVSASFTWPASTRSCASSTCVTDSCYDAACDTRVPAGTYTVIPDAMGLDGARARSTTIRFT